jgi:hypothetical protein
MNAFRTGCVSLLLPLVAGAALAASPVPLSPQGRITDTRRPLFQWTKTGNNLYWIVLLKENTGGWGSLAQSGITWKPQNDLTAGHYRWHVKAGASDSSAPFSPWLRFEIPPACPSPVQPAGWIDKTSTTPVFQWSSSDFDAALFKVELFSGADRLGALSVTGFTKSIFTAAWSSPVPMGNYAWRVKAVYIPAPPYDKIGSDWSSMTHFSVGVPGITTVQLPLEGALFPPGQGSIPLSWTESPGANRYAFRFSRNGRPYDKTWIVTVPNETFSADYTPGHYTLSVQPRNSYGNATWSAPRLFEVTRLMKPGSDITFSESPDFFTWTRTGDGTRYRLRLDRYDPASAAFESFLERWIPEKVSEPQWKPVGPLPDGAYRWRLTDFDGDTPLYTSTDYFQVGVPGRPAYLWPRGPVSGQRDLQFYWAMPPGSPTAYQVLVWKGKALVKNSGWVTNFTKPPPTESLLFSFPNAGAGNYRWAVRARNARGSGPWQESSFKLATLAAPVILAPTNGAGYGAGVKVIITWKAVPDAFVYQVRCRLNGGIQRDFIIPASGNETEEATWIVPVGELEVDIRAKNDGWSPWSSVTFAGLI